MSRKVSKKKKIYRRKRQSLTQDILFFLFFRTVIVILLVIPCLAISYFIKRERLTVVSRQDVIATAYSSTVGQTDNTPCITANGFDLCENGKEEIIAINGLKFGTKVRIPALYGKRVFTVADRMNARYGADRIDIWVTNRDRAVDFGAKQVEIEILK
jgi:3D (Asp-Asp-Asp) domain-containing protein